MTPEPKSATMIRSVSGVEDVAAARQLFEEYAQSLGFSLCFQGFDNELAALPGDYAPPSGRLLLAFIGEAVAGCVGLHKFGADQSNEQVCEIKRLYIRPDYRGEGLGLALTQRAIAEARTIGYHLMRLDTIPGRMDAAIRMYRRLGFGEIPPYRENPIAGALYLELAL